MDTSIPATNGVPSQTEQPSPPDDSSTDQMLPGMVESFASTSTSASPRKTLPLAHIDEPPTVSMISVAREQALVATEHRGSVPLALAASPTLVARWWRLLRPDRFWLSLSPLILGAATAWFEPAKSFSSVFHPMRLLGLALVVLVVHAGANLLNGYYDVRRGADREHALWLSDILQKGLLDAETVRRVALALLGIGGVGLLVLALVSHAWGVLFLGGAAILLAYLYSATPYALGYLPLGELVVGFVMGPAILLSTVQLEGARVSSLAITFSLSLGALAAAVALANNLRDLETDRAASKRTLVTYLGVQIGRTFYLALVLLPYLLVALVAFPHARPHGILLVLLTFSSLVVVITSILRAETPAATNAVVEQTLKLHWRFSFWLLIGYLASVAVVAMPNLIKF